MCCATKRTTNPGNARSEAELACIWCLSVTYLQTGAAQKSSGRDVCTNTLTHKHKNKHNRRTTLHDRLRSSKWMLKSMHSMCCATKRTTNPGNARSEAELACIWCLSVTYFQTGAAQKSSRRDSCTNTLAHKHKNTHAHKHKNKHNRRTTVHDRL